MFGRGKKNQGGGELWSPDGAPPESEETGRGKKRRFAPGPRIDWQPDTPRAPFSARRRDAQERRVEPEPAPRARQEERDNFDDDAEILFEREAPQFDEARGGDRERRGESRYAHVREDADDEDGPSEEEMKRMREKDFSTAHFMDRFEKVKKWMQKHPELAVTIGAAIVAIPFAGGASVGLVLGSAILGYAFGKITGRKDAMPAAVVGTTLWWTTGFQPAFLLLAAAYIGGRWGWDKYKEWSERQKHKGSAHH